MGIPIKDVEKNNLIPTDILKNIPKTCELCGLEIHFTRNLKQIYCPDEFCPGKIASRLYYMVNAIGVNGWDENTCREICKIFKLKSPYQVFLLKDAQCDDIKGFNEKIQAIYEKKQREFELWEVVKLSGVPDLENIAYKLFYGFNKLEEVYEEIEKYQVVFIAEKLGLRNTKSSITAFKIYKTLLKYKNELYFGETQFNITVPEGEKFIIVIDSLKENYINPSEFINYINMKYRGKINAVLGGVVTKKTHVLVVDKEKSIKYKIACRLIEKGYDIKIVTSEELLTWLDEK